MWAGPMFLTCAVTAPAIKTASIAHDVRLPDDVAEQMMSGETPWLAVHFTDGPYHQVGWVLSSGMGDARTPIGLSRVQRNDDPARPFAIRSGIATRVEDRVYDFKETMRGTCKLAREEELK